MLASIKKYSKKNDQNEQKASSSLCQKEKIILVQKSGQKKEWGIFEKKWRGTLAPKCTFAAAPGNSTNSRNRWYKRVIAGKQVGIL